MWDGMGGWVVIGTVYLLQSLVAKERNIARIANLPYPEDNRSLESGKT